MAKKKDKKDKKQAESPAKGSAKAAVAALEVRVETLEKQVLALATALDEALRAG